jgi:DNA-binding GntR family transcriptional regulator
MVGSFAPGQKLELRTLAATLGTSLMPVRDALQRLESLGALVSTAGRTMMVPVLSEAERRDLIRLRLLLESEGVAAAAINRTADKLSLLVANCDAIRRCAQAGDLPGFLTANHAFHICLAQASRIHFLAALLEPLWMRMGPLVRELTPGRDNMLRSVGFHDAIRDAIAARDPDAARKSLAADIVKSNGITLSPQAT